MCIAGPSPQAAPAPVVPSMQSADNLQLGGAQRGAAQIGRLALRIGSPSSAVSGTAAQNASLPGGQQLSASPTPQAAAGGAAAPAAAGTQVGTTNPAILGAAPGSFATVPNPSLRLGAK